MFATPTTNEGMYKEHLLEARRALLVRPAKGAPIAFLLEVGGIAALRRGIFFGPNSAQRILFALNWNEPASRTIHGTRQMPRPRDSPVVFHARICILLASCRLLRFLRSWYIIGILLVLFEYNWYIIGILLLSFEYNLYILTF
jgi:hypothetical protein